MPSRRLPSSLVARIAILGLFLLGGCSYLPRNVEGVPENAPWFSLPLGPFLSEGRGELEAISACAECGPGIVAGVLRLTGPDADKAEAVSRNPQALARALSSTPGRAEVVARAKPLLAASANGFILSLTRADAAKPPVWSASLTQRRNDGLLVILVIGGDEREVEATVRRVAARYCGT
ncbi:hypothetical protein AB4072_09975 [Microvirga sp. 2MCAF38]|uniref:hypothetical protein n=1 Tax=Microvirga sp. 2MCAF38 TaxID=3232989 RepID=UPI003F9DB41B